MAKLRCDVKYRDKNNVFVLSEVVMSFKFATLSESGIEAVSLQMLPSSLAGSEQAKLGNNDIIMPFLVWLS